MKTCDITVYQIVPVPKPRMTQRDKWKKRPCVVRYRAFCDDVRLRGVTLPESGWHVTFYIPMPESWSDSKKGRMNGMPHQQIPDKDNLEKALLDAVFDDDSVVWDGRVTKRWGYVGCIKVEI